MSDALFDDGFVICWSAAFSRYMGCGVYDVIPGSKYATFYRQPVLYYYYYSMIIASRLSNFMHLLCFEEFL